MTASKTTTPPTPVRTAPFPGLPPRFDGKEAQYLLEALQRNTLFYWQGPQADGLVSRMVKRAGEVLGAPHVVATSSGTASLHAAVLAAGVEPGSEVITSPITDMGTCIAILYQNAIPVFAEVDERTYNITAASIEAVITERTKAVIVIHLTGNPAEMDAIAALCKKRNIALIEDCAQAWGATYQGKHVGNLGRFGCFSLNNYKHLSCGDGGLITCQSEPDFKTCHNAADKCYDRYATGVRLTSLAPNYRMTELQGAVALAQFDRLNTIVQKRRTLGDGLSAAIGKVAGVLPPRVVEGGQASYWFYMFRVDEAKLGISRDEFASRLQAQGIPAGKGYIAQPICFEPVFLKKNFFPGGVWPAELVAGRKYDYSKAAIPVTERVLKTAITLPLHEGLSQADVNDYVTAIKRVAASV